MNNVFGLDIGTRNVVGTVGHRTEDGAFIVEAQYVRQHETRSMLDGQIHDIGKVARTISAVKAELEAQLDAPLSEVCIAAAGRVLKTVTTHVEYEYAEESVVTGEDIHTLNLLGVEQAQDILREQNDTKYKFYCVGYSVVKYYLNEEVFISIEGHKANKIGEDIIVTFLPEDVVDGLYSAVGQAKMTVANGDADRCLAVDEKGNIIDGDKLIAILSRYMKEMGTLKNNTAVVTVMSNLGFHRFMNENKIETVCTKVGDRYVLEEMLNNGYNIGGEQSGHIIFLDHATTGDGQLTAAQTLELLSKCKRPLSQLVKDIPDFPQLLVNVKITENKKGLWEKTQKITDIIAQAEQAMGENGRILVRESGTEPLVRVMIEGKDEKEVHHWTHIIADTIKECLCR